MAKIIIQVIKSPYLSLVILTIGLVILFAPESVVENFGFKQIQNNHIVIANIPAKTIIGVLTFLAMVSLSYQSIKACWIWNSRRTQRNGRIKLLSSLSLEERTILAYCFVQRQQTINLEVTHPWANALASKGLLYPGQVVNILAVPFTVPQYVWDKILKTPSLIFGDDDPYGPEVTARLREIHRHIRRHT